MKRNISNWLLFIIIISILSCTTENDRSENKLNEGYSYVKRDKDFDNLAKIVSIALNKDRIFREIIKKEALIKFDGDYDILMSSFKGKTISDKNKSTLNISTYLSNYAKMLNIEFESNQKNEEDYIDYLTNLYPNLQISIPVHAEDWDDSIAPKVTFIPVDIEENVTEFMTGYDNQQQIQIDAINTPNEPIVVIGLCERRVINDNENEEVPPSPSNLQAIQTQSSIKLQWTQSNSTNNVLGYRIYRKETTSSNFILYATIYGPNNMIYDDVSVQSNNFYSYYVKSFNIWGDSSPSNIVNAQAPSYPQALINFNTILHSTSLLEIQWGIPTNQSVDFVELDKIVINQDNDYVTVGQFNPNILHYMDYNPIQGKKVIYRSAIHTGNAHSNYVHDFVIVPYRDVSQSTKVFVEEISFNWEDIGEFESWWKGSPEFRMAVVMGSPNSGVTIQEGMEFEFCGRHSWNRFNDRNIFNWQPSEWSEMLTMKVIEYDDWTPDIDLNLSASYKKKKVIDSLGSSTEFGLDGSKLVTIEDFLDSADTPIGLGYLKYYDPETRWVDFGNYGFKIKISTVDTNQVCFP